MKRMKRVLVAIVSFALIFSGFSLPTYADEPADPPVLTLEIGEGGAAYVDYISADAMTYTDAYFTENQVLEIMLNTEVDVEFVPVDPGVTAFVEIMTDPDTFMSDVNPLTPHIYHDDIFTGSRTVAGIFEPHPTITLINATADPGSPVGIVPEFTGESFTYTADEAAYDEIPSSLQWVITGDYTGSGSGDVFTLESIGSDVTIEAVYDMRDLLHAGSVFDRVIEGDAGLLDKIVDYQSGDVLLADFTDIKYVQGETGTLEVDVQLGNPSGGSLQFFPDTEDVTRGTVEASADSGYVFTGFRYLVYLNLDDNYDSTYDGREEDYDRIREAIDHIENVFSIDVNISGPQMDLQAMKHVDYPANAHLEAEFIIYVTAGFEPDSPPPPPPPEPEEYVLTVLVVGPGSVPGFEGDSSHDSGTNVNLGALVDDPSLYIFDGWSGDVTSADEAIVVVMNMDKTVTATFIDIPPIEPPEEPEEPEEEILDVEPIPEAAPEEDIVDEELPETGGVPFSVLSMAGLGIIGTGVKLRKKR